MATAATATSPDPVPPDPTPPPAGPALTAVPDPVPRHREPVPRPPGLRLLRYEPDPDEPPIDFAVRPETTQCASVVGPPQPDGAPETAVLRGRAGHVVRLALEVLDGRRPLAHLTPYLEPSALRYLRAAHAQRPVVRPPSRLTSLHVSRPCADAVEVAAVYRLGGRARALAARFEAPARDGTASKNAAPDGHPAGGADWRCVTLRLL
jgi:hypothetical protein